MTEKSNNEINPATIRRHADAAMNAFAMLAGMQLDVFTPLKNGPMSAEALANSLDVQVIKLRPLLYSLVMADLLIVDNGIFSNTDEANRFLVTSSPDYMGGWVSDFYSRRWNAVLQTAKTIRKGEPQAKLDFEALDEDKLFKLFSGYHPGAVAAGKELAKLYDFTGFKKLMDAGGGIGGLAIGLCESYQNLKGTIVDLADVMSISKQFISEAHMSDRINVIATDLIDSQPEGTYDVAVLRALIQTLSPDQAKSVLENIGKALEPGGSIYILGYVIDDTHLRPSAFVHWNLHFLNIYDDGRAFTESEHREWLTDAGFSNISIEYETMPSSLSIVSACKV